MNIYIIQAHQFFKIGKANNVQSRVAALSTSNPFDLHLIATKEALTEKEAYTMECDIHREYQKFRKRGEWFNLRPDQVSHIIATHTFTQLRDVNTRYDTDEINRLLKLVETLHENELKWQERREVLVEEEIRERSGKLLSEGLDYAIRILANYKETHDRFNQV